MLLYFWSVSVAVRYYSCLPILVMWKDLKAPCPYPDRIFYVRVARCRHLKWYPALVVSWSTKSPSNSLYYRSVVYSLHSRFYWHFKCIFGGFIWSKSVITNFLELKIWRIVSFQFLLLGQPSSVCLVDTLRFNWAWVGMLQVLVSLHCSYLSKSQSTFTVKYLVISLMYV